MGSVCTLINRFFLASYKITGPEVIAQATRVLEAISEASIDFDLKLESHEFGGCAIDSTGEPLPASTLKACQEANAILMGECRFKICTSAI